MDLLAALAVLAVLAVLDVDLLAADFSGSSVPTTSAQWFIIGGGQSSCPPHNPPKYRPEKDPKVTKTYFLTHFARSLKLC